MKLGNYELLSSVMESAVLDGVAVARNYFNESDMAFLSKGSSTEFLGKNPQYEALHLTLASTLGRTASTHFYPDWVEPGPKTLPINLTAEALHIDTLSFGMSALIPLAGPPAQFCWEVEDQRIIQTTYQTGDVLLLRQGLHVTDALEGTHTLPQVMHEGFAPDWRKILIAEYNFDGIADVSRFSQSKTQDTL